MNILDLLDKDRASRLIYEKSQDSAWELYQQEKDALKSISSTQGFVVIRQYRAREKDACEQRLSTMTSEDIKTVQGELRLAKRFLDYLDNMLLDVVI